MPDSANILSILSALGQGQQPAAQTNVLQSIAPQEPYYNPPPQQASPAADIAQAAVAASPPTPKPRHSLIDTIGRIADVFAKVGGADALYQPTLDAREAKDTARSDHALTVDSATIKNATDQFALTTAHNKALAQAGRALQAIKDNGGDISKAWPVLAARMQFDPATVQSVGTALATDPTTIAGLSALDGDASSANSKYSGNVVYAVNKADGSLHAFQANQSNGDARDILPDGFTPVDPLKFINTGGAQVGVGTYSGTPKKILPVTARPDTILTTTTQRDIAQGNNQTQLTIAGMPARSQGGTGAKASDPRAGLKIISDIQTSFDNLHKLQALPGEGGTAGNLIGAVGRTALGQKIGATTGLSSAAQERELLAKNLANLQSDLIKSLPGNATRTRFEQEIQKKRLPDPATMNYNTANRAIAEIRDAYLVALKAQQTPVVRPAAKASQGWSVVGVK